MNIAGICAVFLGAGVVVYLLFALGAGAWMDPLPETASEPDFSLSTYLDFVAVLLTAVTTILAALAIGIGMVAAYTIQSMKADARTTVSDEVNRLLSDDIIKGYVKQSVAEELYREIRGLDNLDKDIRLDDDVADTTQAKE